MDIAESAATPLCHPMLRAVPAAPSTTDPTASGSMDSESLQAHRSDDWCVQAMDAPSINEDALNGLLPPLGTSPPKAAGVSPVGTFDIAHSDFDDLFSGTPCFPELHGCVPSCMQRSAVSDSTELYNANMHIAMQVRMTLQRILWISLPLPTMGSCVCSRMKTSQPFLRTSSPLLHNPQSMHGCCHG